MKYTIDLAAAMVSIRFAGVMFILFSRYPSTILLTPKWPNLIIFSVPGLTPKRYIASPDRQVGHGYPRDSYTILYCSHAASNQQSQYVPQTMIDAESYPLIKLCTAPLAFVTGS